MKIPEVVFLSWNRNPESEGEGLRFAELLWLRTSCAPVWLRLMAQSLDPQMLAAITQSVLQAVSVMPQVMQNKQLSGSADDTQLSTAKSDSTCGIRKDSAGAARLEGSTVQEGSAAPQEESEDRTVSEGEDDLTDHDADEDKEEETEKKSGKQSGKKKNKGVTPVGKSGGRKGKRVNEEGDAASKPLKKKRGENSNGDGDGLSGTETEGSAPVAVGQKGSDTVRSTRSSVAATTDVQAAPAESKPKRGRPPKGKSDGTPAPDEGVRVTVPSVMIDYHSYCMLCNKVESMSTRLDELMGKVDMLLRRPSRSPPPGTYGYHTMPQYNHGMTHASSSTFIPQHNNQYQDAPRHG